MQSPKAGRHTWPLHRALTVPITIAGIPRDLAFILWTIVAAFAFGLRVWEAMVPGLILHVAAIPITKLDPDFIGVVKRYLRYRDFYHL